MPVERNPLRNSQILALADKHPTWTYSEIAARIGGITRNVVAGVLDRYRNQGKRR